MDTTAIKSVQSEGAVASAAHPAAGDEAYWRRREAINAAVAARGEGAPIPLVDYLEEEDAVWRQVSEVLGPRHRRHACTAFLDGVTRLDLPRDRIPQLREVDRCLRALTGFSIRPVGGLVGPTEFYGSLAERAFCSTQYVRHHATPFYTPEPDIVHELIGHATMLAEPDLAALYQLAGTASRRAESESTLDFFSRVFWFALEFGVVLEEGRPKAYGAGLLSSCGEIEAFTAAEMRPFDLAAMGTTDYDITHYQPLLFLAPSFSEMTGRLGEFFSAFDDELAERLRREAQESQLRR